MQAGPGAMIDSTDGVRVSVKQLVSLSREAEGLSLNARRARAQFAGEYLSPFKGRGMEFDESRPYQAGDDVRNLDWRVMARTGRAHTKLFREERERPVFMWVDLRAPMFFATRGAYKSVVAARSAALLAWAAQRQGDRVGGIVFSDTTHEEIRPTSGKPAVLRFLNRLVANSAWQNRPTKIEQHVAGRAVNRLRRVAHPGSLVFLFSDFRNIDAPSEAGLARIAQHSDVVMVFIYDPLEHHLPPPGTYRVSDGDRELLLDTHDTAYRRHYESQFDAHIEHLQRMARQYRMRLVACRTDQEPLNTLRTGLGLGVR